MDFQFFLGILYVNFAHSEILVLINYLKRVNISKNAILLNVFSEFLQEKIHN